MDDRSGVFFAIAAYTIWGLLPVYWKLFDEITAMEVLAHRIIWSFIFVTIILVIWRRISHLKTVISDRRTFILIVWAAVFITLNWGLYIWGVTSGHIVESSMGYFIEPILMVFLGLMVFKESLNYWQVIALISAFTGVVFLVIRYEKFPWFALSLAATFAVYGMLKKKIEVSSMVSLGLETAIVLPLAIFFIGFRQFEGGGVFGTTLLTHILIIGVGPATALPLLLFAEGARRVKMSTLGFTQYISPTISLLLGIFIYHETFTIIHLISFSFIWLGLIIYSISLFSRSRPARTGKKYISTD